MTKVANESNTVDVLVLGGGSGGYSCALRAAQLGLSVALVEENKIGGTCLHVGCIPTKTLLHAAEVADTVRSAAGLGIVSTLDKVDMGAVARHRDAVVGKLYTGLTGLLASRGITVVNGRGTVVGDRTVEVDGAPWAGRHLVLATGSQTRSLPGLEVDGDRVLDSTSALALERVPASVVILGGGVIGCEFASLWRSLGSEVTIVEAQSRLLPGEDADSSRALARAFARRGIEVRTSERYESIAPSPVGVNLQTSEGTIEAEVALVAIGRGPVSAGMGFEEHGVELREGFVVCDERLRTTAPHVYAVGDLVAGPQLAHRGFSHGVFVAEEIAGLGPVLVADDLVPRVTYSDPEVASVGLSEEAARDRFGKDGATSVTYDLAGNGKSQILETRGFVKVVRRSSGPVVGVHLVGRRAGELIGEAQLATAWEALPEDVVPLFHAHPSQHEALGEAFLALAGKPLHAHT